MTAQLEAMSIASHLDLLGYFLGMARAESELFIRTNALADDETEIEGEGDEDSEPTLEALERAESHSFD